MKIIFYILISIFSFIIPKDIYSNYSELNIIENFIDQNNINSNNRYKINSQTLLCDADKFYLEISTNEFINYKISYDFILNYDSDMVIPTGNIFVLDELIEPNYIFWYRTINYSQSNIFISLAVQTYAPPNTYFSGQGALCYVEFQRLNEFECFENTDFTISNFLENSTSGYESLNIDAGSVDLYNEFPNTYIYSPTKDTTVNLFDIVNVKVSANDVDGQIEKIDFYVDGNLVGTDSTCLYSLEIQFNNPGLHIVNTVATDNLGLTKITSNLLINVVAPPFVKIISPKENENFYDPDVIDFEVEPDQTEIIDIFKVEFYVDNVLIFEDFDFPYIISLPDVKTGEYKLRAKVIGFTGFNSTTQEIDIQVFCVREDLDNNGTVQNSDFLIFVSIFNTTCQLCRADFNDDGIINNSDFLSFISKFNATCD